MKKVILSAICCSMLALSACGSNNETPYDKAFNLFNNAHSSYKRENVCIKDNSKYYSYISGKWELVNNLDTVGYPIDNSLYSGYSFNHFYKEEEIKEAFFVATYYEMVSTYLPTDRTAPDYFTEKVETQMCFYQITSSSDKTRLNNNAILSFNIAFPSDLSLYEGDVFRLTYVGELVYSEHSYVSDKYEVVHLYNLGNENRFKAKLVAIPELSSISTNLYIKIDGDSDLYILYGADHSFDRRPVYYSDKNVNIDGDLKLPKQAGMSIRVGDQSAYYTLYGGYEGLELSVIKMSIFSEYGERYCYGAYFIDYNPDGKELMSILCDTGYCLD